MACRRYAMFTSFLTLDLGVVVKRLVALVVVGLIGFYVAWPAWSGYRIATALSSQDETALAGKVDFPAVRESLRPVALSEVGKRIDKEAGAFGPLAQAMGGDLKNQMTAKLVDQVLSVLVTPQSVIRLAQEGGEIGASIEKAVTDAAGKMGGAGGISGGGATGSGALSGVFGQ